MPQAEGAALAAQAAQEIMRYNLGLAGIVIVVLGLYVWIQHKTIRELETKRVEDLKTCEESRVKDQKDVITQLITMSERQTTSIVQQTAIATGLKDALEELRCDLEKERE